MANQRLRRNRCMVLLMGLAIILTVEYLQIFVVIGDYEVEGSGKEDDRPIIPTRTGVNRIGKSLKLRKPSSLGVEDVVEENMKEKGIALETERQVEKRGLRKSQEHSAEKFKLKGHKSEEDEGVEKRAHKKQVELHETDIDDVNVARELNFVKQLLLEDSKASGNSDKLPLQPDESDAEIHVNTSRPVLNPHPFRYLINTPNMCKGVKVFLLCYVHTAVSHPKRRKRIRQTWGNRTNYPGVEIRVVFFVGLPELNTTRGQLYQDYLKFESKRYGDIVQEDYLDTYRNLSHKGVGALKWIATYCNHTEYVLKTDDDMFVNMYIILNHLRSLHAQNFRRRLILCYVFWKMHVDREGGQWSLPKDYFPDDLYPPYCSGMGFVVSKDVAIAMYRVSPFVRFLWVDDAFISGVLPAALQDAVNHTSWARTYCAAFEMGVYTHPTEWYKYIFSHVHNETLNLMTWEGLTNIVRNRTIPKPSVIKPGHLADEYIPLHKLFSPR